VTGPQRVLIGVDAGGTHTTAAVADANGTVLVRAEGAPGVVRPGDAEGAAARIVDTCREALVKAERPVHGDVLVAGAAGTGREVERLALQAALEGTRLFTRVFVTHDGAIALQAAFGEGAGIVLIAGTGSIAWGRLPGGETVRAGGLGPALGDQGSGYDVGRAGLRAVGLALEGMGPRTALAERLLRRLHLGGVDDLTAWTGAAPVQAVAALAPDVLAAAEEGDAVAAALADAGADALAHHVATVAARFPGGHAVPVALGGGLLARSEAYRKRVVARVLAEVGSAEVRPDIVDAVLGAVHLARSL
jgi:glucosamine kinase